MKVEIELEEKIDETGKKIVKVTLTPNNEHIKQIVKRIIINCNISPDYDAIYSEDSIIISSHGDTSIEEAKYIIDNAIEDIKNLKKEKYTVNI